MEKGPSWFSLDTISWEVLSDGGGFRFLMGSLNLLEVYISIIPDHTNGRSLTIQSTDHHQVGVVNIPGTFLNDWIHDVLIGHRYLGRSTQSAQIEGYD